MKEISLSNGLKTIVDDDDYENLVKYKWCANSKRGKYYASKGYGSKIVYMHRLLAGATKPDQKVDHIDQNTLNNQKSNLRICTNSQNMQNRNKTKANKTGYKGVHYSIKENRFIAQIQVGWKKVFLGRYKSAEEAAVVYDDASKKYHGEYRRKEIHNEQKRT